MSKKIPRQYAIDFDSLSDEALMRLACLIALGILPFSVATLWRKVAKGEFPAPIKVSAGVTTWRVGSIREWLKDPSGYRANKQPGATASQSPKAMQKGALIDKACLLQTKHLDTSQYATESNLTKSRATVHPARVRQSSRSLESDVNLQELSSKAGGTK